MIFLWFFLKAIAESVSARKARDSRTPDSGDGTKKSVGGRERRGRNPSLSQFLSFAFFPLRSILRHSPLSEHLKQASATRKAAIHKEIFLFRYTTNTKIFRGAPRAARPHS